MRKGNVKLNVRKSWYKDAQIVEWDYAIGATNHVGLGDDCAVRTQTVSVVGKIIEINNEDMVIENIEIGKARIEYGNITGIFPCSL